MRAYVFSILFSLLAAATLTAETSEPAIIPAPQKMEISKGQFRLSPDVHIVVDRDSGDTAQYLATKLRASTGYPLLILTNAELSPEKAVIQITMKGAKADLGPEGYELNVTPDAVEITAPAQAGLFYGAQTFLQLLPPQIFASAPVTNVAWEIPFTVHIEDQPRFKWRGFMLDVSRHFFPKEDVKRVLDEMAMHKLNTFHWHLTDDQGWRIEIKKYPRLTEVGAWRKQSKFPQSRDEADNEEKDNYNPAWSVAPPTAYGPDGRYGGFYTQDDVREIVAYAAARHITVVPEIEMPGHAVAALAAYPQLSCDGGPYSTEIKTGVNRGVFCVGNDEVFKFLDDVLTEVFQLFPDKYIHVGGDEVNAAVKKSTWGVCPSCQARMKAEGFTNLDQLQGWFTGQIGKFVNEHGKTLIGWSEIADAPLPQNAAVMDWIGGAVQTATNGHDVVMTPTRYCYFDYYQSLDHGTEPPAIGGFLPLDRVYSFEPVPAGLPSQFQSRILGGQANLWTEYVPSLAHAEYMMFPRLCALAEVDWSPKGARDWDTFKERLQSHELRLDQLGVNYRRDLSVKIGAWSPAQLISNAAATNLEWDVTPHIKESGQYRITFQYTRGGGLVINSVSLLEDEAVVATDAHAGYAARNPTRPVYVLNSTRKESAKYTLRASVAGADSSGTVSLVFWQPNKTR